MTNLEGVFAGGDVIGGLLQIAKAVSDGANAATKIKKYLLNKSEWTSLFLKWGRVWKKSIYVWRFMNGFI